MAILFVDDDIIIRFAKKTHTIWTNKVSSNTKPRLMR